MTPEETEFRKAKEALDFFGVSEDGVYERFIAAADAVERVVAP